MDIVCCLSLNISLSCRGRVRQKKTAGGLAGAGSAVVSPTRVQPRSTYTAWSQQWWWQWLGTATARLSSSCRSFPGDGAGLFGGIVSGLARGTGSWSPWCRRRLQNLLGFSGSRHRQSLSLVFPHFSLICFSQCSVFFLLCVTLTPNTFFLLNVCLGLKISITWLFFYLSILHFSGIFIIYTAILGLKKGFGIFFF